MSSLLLSFFFFNDTATTEIYTLSLHDALPISDLSTSTSLLRLTDRIRDGAIETGLCGPFLFHKLKRSEEHTSELQSLTNLVCRLLLEKKKSEGWNDQNRRAESLTR